MLNGNKPQASPGANGGSVIYRGTWNATTNSPTLVSSTGTAGDYFIVSVAGSTNLDGITSWNIGDWAVFNGSVWQKVDNTDAVTSVFTRTGAVIAVAGDYAASEVDNDSSVTGTTVKDALDNLLTGVTVSDSILSVTNAVDMKTVAATPIYTVPVGKSAIITKVIYVMDTASAITIGPNVGIGVAAGEDDIIFPQAITGFDASAEYFVLQNDGTSKVASAGDIIKVGIDTGATATTMLVDVYLLGFLI